MDACRCLQILREVKDVAFATVDEWGCPQVRIIDVMIVEEEVLYFCTARGKHFHKELMAEGKAAVTAMNKDYQMIRLNGNVRKLPDQKKWIDRIFEENPSMKAVYPGEARYILDAFCIEEGEVEFFDLLKEPIVRESFSLGSGKVTEKGFRITDACIRCGRCEEVCPQSCIRDYEIQQKHCLHCGLCYEECGVNAIVRRENN